MCHLGSMLNRSQCKFNRLHQTCTKFLYWKRWVCDGRTRNKYSFLCKRHKRIRHLCALIDVFGLCLQMWWSAFLKVKWKWAVLSRKSSRSTILPFRFKFFLSCTLTRRTISVKAQRDQISHFIKITECLFCWGAKKPVIITTDSKSQEDRPQGPTV